ncbi:hypothetical protein BD414DRAFT_286545 [Trametes punicea]|nr:hypothetical protein BD414DRAFT_286545 [Trametes punicea]
MRAFFSPIDPRRGWQAPCMSALLRPFISPRRLGNAILQYSTPTHPRHRTVTKTQLGFSPDTELGPRGRQVPSVHRQHRTVVTYPPLQEDVAQPEADPAGSSGLPPAPSEPSRAIGRAYGRSSEERRAIGEMVRFNTAGLAVAARRSSVNRSTGVPPVLRTHGRDFPARRPPVHPSRRAESSVLGRYDQDQEEDARHRTLRISELPRTAESRRGSS